MGVGSSSTAPKDRRTVVVSMKSLDDTVDHKPPKTKPLPSLKQTTTELSDPLPDLGVANEDSNSLGGGEPSYSAVGRRKSVFVEPYNPEDDEDDEKPVRTSSLKLSKSGLLKSSHTSKPKPKTIWEPRKCRINIH